MKALSMTSRSLLLLTCLAAGDQAAEAQGEGKEPFTSLRSYLAEETMGPPENMGYISARCASLNNIGAVVARTEGDEEIAEAFTQRSENWVDLAYKMQAEAMSLDGQASQVIERVADELAASREDYMALLTGSSAAESPNEARTIRGDMKVCAFIYEAFKLGG